MEIRWLRTALCNLDDEARYIQRQNPDAARDVVARIYQAVDLLGDNPAIGRPGRVPGMRELVVPRSHYIVPYRVRTRLQRVEILRVFHVSRRLPKRW